MEEQKNNILIQFIMDTIDCFDNKPKKLKNLKRCSIDWGFLLIVLGITVGGLLMMYSASYAWALAEGSSQGEYLGKQLIFALIGVFAMLFIAIVPYNLYMQKWVVWPAYLGSLVLMILCFVPGIGHPVNSAYRWIKIGFTFEPSELAKIALILLFAYFLSANFDKRKNFATVFWCYMFVAAYCLILALQPHISCAIIMLLIALFVLIVADANGIWTILGTVAAVCAGLGFMLIKSMTSDVHANRLDRIKMWLDPFNSAFDEDAWQTRNSLIAIGSGGWTGLGFGESRQKHLYLPESKNDFVFSIVCEELGFIGAIVVILAFVLLVIKGFSIAKRAVDKQGTFLATGITLHIGVQALLNIAVVTNAMPNTGVSLPFFSYGGTALALQLAEMGVLLSISSHAKKTKEEIERDQRQKEKKLQEKEDLARLKDARRRARVNQRNKR